MLFELDTAQMNIFKINGVGVLLVIETFGISKYDSRNFFSNFFERGLSQMIAIKLIQRFLIKVDFIPRGIYEVDY